MRPGALSRALNSRHPLPSGCGAGLPISGVVNYRSGGGDVAPPTIAAVPVFRQFSPCLSRCASNSGQFMIYDPRPSATASPTGFSFRSVRGRVSGDRPSCGEHSAFDAERGPASVSGRRDPARGPVWQREPECWHIVQWKSGGSDENGTHHRSSRLRRCDIDPGRCNLATGGGSGDGDGLDDGTAVVAAPRRRSLISTWPNIARYHSRFWTGELRDDRCVFPVFRACAAP